MKVYTLVYSSTSKVYVSNENVRYYHDFYSACKESERLYKLGIHTNILIHKR